MRDAQGKECRNEESGQRIKYFTKRDNLENEFSAVFKADLLFCSKHSVFLKVHGLMTVVSLTNVYYNESLCLVGVNSRC